MADDTKPHDRALINKYPFIQKATHDNFAAFVDQTPATSKEVAAFHVHGHATATGVVKAYADSGVEVKTAHLHYQAKLALLEDHWHGKWYPDGYINNTREPPRDIETSAERPGYITQAMLESSAGFTAKSARRALELFRDYHQIKGPKRKQAKSLKEDTPDASSIEIVRRDKNASQISEPTLDTNADPKDPLFDESQAQAADLKMAMEPMQTMNADVSGLSLAEASMPLLDSMMTEDLGQFTDIFDPSAIMQDPYDSEESCISADGIIRHILGRPGIDVEPVTAAERGIAEAAKASEVKKEEAKAKRRQNLAEKKEAALEMTEEEKTDAYADALAKEAEKIGRKLGLPASKRRKVVRDARDAVYRNL
ncbi:hypothetical protein K4K54_001655 [Colletotrichum sp. SAR 10_86]|nr:hypothetical protein K4K51_003257 [Colletotrichum sp. SAR 10_75]KAI8229181.1 hypothetical protein K4K54_001655 [Colletotrichum sp. SAR 10_86]